MMCLCYLLNHRADVQIRQARVSGGNAGMGMCQHAKVILSEDGNFKPDIPKADPVIFGGDGVMALAQKVVDNAVLGEADAANIGSLASEAEKVGVGLAVRLGDTQAYAVRDANNRSTPGDWAHVHTTGVVRGAGTKPAPSQKRRSTNLASIACKVNMFFSRRLSAFVNSLWAFVRFHNV